MKFSIPLLTLNEVRVDVLHFEVEDGVVTRTPTNDTIFLAPLSNTWYIPISHLPSKLRHKIFFDGTQCYWVAGKCHYGKLRDILERELASSVLKPPTRDVPNMLGRAKECVHSVSV